MYKKLILKIALYKAIVFIVLIVIKLNRVSRKMLTFCWSIILSRVSIRYTCRKNRESLDVNFSRTKLCVSYSLSQKRIIICIYDTCTGHHTGTQYTLEVWWEVCPPVSYILLKCSSNAVSTRDLYFIPTRSFRYFLSFGIYTGETTTANIWQCVPGRRGELCAG